MGIRAGRVTGHGVVQQILQILLMGCLLGCPPQPPPEPENPCEVASARLGVLACLHRLPDLDSFGQVSQRSPAVDQLNGTKFLIPVEPVEDFDTLFVNVNEIALHYDLMATGFPNVFPGLTRQQYIELVTSGPDRPYLAGNLTEYIDGSSTFFGFTVWDDPAQMDNTLTYEQALQVYLTLMDRVTMRPLVFVPHSAAQRAAAESWNAAFPIRGVDNSVIYEPYTVGVGYGTVRLYALADFAEATAQAEYGFQDILVLDEAPFDVERVISGAVTGTRQGELSHLNVRSAARGTPNCFVLNPMEAFAEWEGRLVRMECGEEGWSVEETTVEEAEAWWDALRPDPVEIVPPDLEHLTLAGLHELPTDTAEERLLGVSRYGSKGSNLAVLYQRIPTDAQLDGFLVPFAWYDAFMNTNYWNVDLGMGEVSATFQETVEYWLSEEQFLTDALVRRDRLEALRGAMRAAPHDPDLIEALEQKIVEVYGSDTTMVRFRSSSNAEDALSFSGAGLYDSTSVCLADELDDDSVGPSRCDPSKDPERSVSRGLGKVWASMWNMAAYEERDWYKINHGTAVMGILVNTRSADEEANIVAFSGNPTASDDRVLVNSQIGELDVVSSEPGVYPEKSLLDIENGTVAEIVRVNHSSEVPDGWVLTDSQLTDLGVLFSSIEESFPLDHTIPEGHTLLLDTEWKVLSDGRLIIKQIRPFLRTD